MRVDEGGGDEVAGGVDRADRVGVDGGAEVDDAAVLDGDVEAGATVGQRRAADDEVEHGQAPFPSAWARSCGLRGSGTSGQAERASLRCGRRAAGFGAAARDSMWKRSVS